MATEEAYMLVRDSAESKRLDTQHEYMRALGHGHLIHPLIDTSKIRRVADVGTGTGIWLQETAQELANARSTEDKADFVGFDMSSEQYPEQSPPGIVFVVHDVVRPFPDDWREKFDLVHVRLLDYALQAKHLWNAVENIVNLIRPGGFLQWEECDAIDCWAVPETKRTQDMVLYVISERVSRGLTPSIVTPLLKAIQSLPLHPQDGTYSPLTSTGDLMRVMQLETIATTNHEAPLVNSIKQDQVLTAGIFLNQAGISRRLAHLSDPKIPKDKAQQLEGDIAKRQELVDATKRGEDPASSQWDMEMTRIVARKAIVVDVNGGWMSARK